MATKVVFVNESSFTDSNRHNLLDTPLEVHSTDTVQFVSTRSDSVTVSYAVGGENPGRFELVGRGEVERPASGLDGTLQAPNARGGTMSGQIDVSGGGDGNSLAALRQQPSVAHSKTRQTKARVHRAR